MSINIGVFIYGIMSFARYDIASLCIEQRWFFLSVFIDIFMECSLCCKPFLHVLSTFISEPC